MSRTPTESHRVPLQPFHAAEDSEDLSRQASQESEVRCRVESSRVESSPGRGVESRYESRHKGSRVQAGLSRVQAHRESSPGRPESSPGRGVEELGRDSIDTARHCVSHSQSVMSHACWFISALLLCSIEGHFTQQANHRSSSMPS